MPRIVIERANQTQNEALKRMLRENTPEGMIRVRYEREPDFIGGSVVEGTDLNVSCAREVESDTLAGIVMRATKPCFIGQEKQLMGYLSSLRIQKAYRGSLAFIRFIQGLKKVHEDSPCKWDLMMLTDGNGVAEKILLSGRAGLPTAYFLGDYFTHVIALRRSYRLPDLPGIKVRKLRDADWEQWFAFLHKTGAKNRELFPAYQPDHLDPEKGLLKGLQAEQVYVALENGKIIGTMSAWDQNAFKQNYIDGYGGAVKYLRRPLNALARLTGKPVLPKQGAQLRSIFLGAICIEDDRAPVFQLLMKRVLNDLQNQAYHSLMAGFHQSDPLLPLLKSYPHIAYTSHAWLFSWEKVDTLVSHLQQSNIYLELGAL